MTPDQSLNYLQNLAQTVMAAGGFKDFKELDKCRQALDTYEKLITAVVGTNTEQIKELVNGKIKTVPQ